MHPRTCIDKANEPKIQECSSIKLPFLWIPSPCLILAGKNANAYQCRQALLIADRDFFSFFLRKRKRMTAHASKADTGSVIQTNKYCCFMPLLYNYYQ